MRELLTAIAVVAGTVGLITCVGRWAGGWLRREPPAANRCPHGFVDWDACPVCRH